VDNSYVGEGGYRERKMGGSLYGLRNIYRRGHRPQGRRY
jgi:hypothetical protein